MNAKNAFALMAILITVTSLGWAVGYMTGRRKARASCQLSERDSSVIENSTTLLDGFQGTRFPVNPSRVCVSVYDLKSGALAGCVRLDEFVSSIH